MTKELLAYRLKIVAEALETGKPLRKADEDLITLNRKYVDPLINSLGRLLKLKLTTVPSKYRKEVEDLLDDEIRNLGVGMSHSAL